MREIEQLTDADSAEQNAPVRQTQPPVKPVLAGKGTHNGTRILRSPILVGLRGYAPAFSFCAGHPLLGIPALTIGSQRSMLSVAQPTRNVANVRSGGTVMKLGADLFHAADHRG